MTDPAHPLWPADQPSQPLGMTLEHAAPALPHPGTSDAP